MASRRMLESLQADPTLWERAVGKVWGSLVVLPSGCWEYQGHRNKRNSYGTFSLWVRGLGRSQVFYVHRVAFSDAEGLTAPASLHVLHTCDNPPCCNPAHLFSGTQADNMADMKAKGRHTRGEDCTFSKLSEADALEIIRLSASRSTKSLAVQFGIQARQVQRIIKGDRWAHLPRP